MPLALESQAYEDSPDELAHSRELSFFRCVNARFALGVCKVLVMGKPIVAIVRRDKHATKMQQSCNSSVYIY